jgi:hypothetical protein
MRSLTLTGEAMLMMGTLLPGCGAEAGPMVENAPP